MKRENKKYVINLGGSTAFTEKIDTNYLRRFSDFIKREIKKGNKFIIVCGGGHVTRKYQKAVSKIVKADNEDKDLIGISATRLNAQFLKTVFKKLSHPLLFDERFKIKDFGKHSIVIGCGFKPGNSTDFVAFRIAADFKLKEVIILGKPDYVYTADFEKYPDAKPIKEMTWIQYLKMFPLKWKPGMHSPVDPPAALLAKKEKIKAIVADGRNIKNFEKILQGKKYKGTTIY